ncbi:unnamed protein product [Triticum turgidum subsp. durum]|uniref:F-box domain-containing protein n=1 Tax=Triticum turgidum subsp. durum TaxID=4567 RepID=A0A9R0UZQ8_TRITD|nr:unnamed protein product [Triticum turgidum subsp. durum]
MDPAGLLPGDVLADVLRRLMPRSLAACRSVCKEWCAAVDAHGLLRKDLLPLSLAGIFAVYNFVDGYHLPPAFLSRPSVAGKIQGNLSYLDDVHDEWSHIMGHCNGLLLLWGGVANPATRQWACLPRHPDRTATKGFIKRDFLAYDPMVSPHFEVFFMQCVRRRSKNEVALDLANPNSEWPPSPYTMSAFSSETWLWEERSFIREGMAPRSIDPKLLPLMKNVLFPRDAVYWRGRLYVYNIFFVIRLDLGDNKYRVIELPPISEARGDIMPHLGKSGNGVYYGFVGDCCKLQIWFLNESIDHTEWMLKHEIGLKPLLENFPWEHSHGSWFVQGLRDNNDETLDREKLEWDSDNDDATTASATEVSVQKKFHKYISRILGFHPYKEIIFLHISDTRVVAYHLKNSKVEDLGCLPVDGDDWIQSSCVYTPCWIESCLRANNVEPNSEL